MADRDRKTVLDQMQQAQQWLGRAAAAPAGLPNRNCAAHEHMADGQRALCNGLSLLLSDKVAALESADARVALAEVRAERADGLARKMMWIAAASALGGGVSAVSAVLIVVGQRGA